MQYVVVVEDKDSMARMLKETLEAEGYKTACAANGRAGIELLKSDSPDMVLTDLNLPAANGIEVLKSSKEDNPLRPVIVMTAFGTIETAVEAMRLGAYDFITKPLNMDHLLLVIKRALDAQSLAAENIVLREAVSGKGGATEIVGVSAAIKEVDELVRRVAPMKTTVLLQGSSGTGKELFARAIHNSSDRGGFPFVAVNCAAIPRDLLESELFGHEKGAFTGADSRRGGKFELAHNGTLFLDEIGEMDRSLQSKLLRVLQEDEFYRLGGSRPVRVNVRVIAASNKSLEQAVEEGAFREDLFYRLNVFPIRIPDLKERREDIPLLARHFIARFARELKSPVKGITDEAMSALTSYHWRGNVRELENAIERAVILCTGETIGVEHLPQRTPRAESGGALSFDGTLDEVSRKALQAAVSDRIRRALKETRGNKSKAALMLDVSYKTLLTKIKEYGVE